MKVSLYAPDSKYQNLPVCIAVNVERQINILKQKHPYKYEGAKISEAFQQAIKSAYRFIFYRLKTTFEGIELGYDDFKDAFLASFEQILPGGYRVRIGDMITPYLTSERSLLNHFKELPDPKEKNG